MARLLDRGMALSGQTRPQPFDNKYQKVLCMLVYQSWYWYQQSMGNNVRTMQWE